MAEQIATVASIDGIYFVKNPDGTLHQLSKGDPIYEGQVVFGFDGNSPISSVILTMNDGSDIVILGNDRQLFDSSLSDSEFSVDETISDKDSIEALINETPDDQSDEIETAAGEDVIVASHLDGDTTFKSIDDNPTLNTETTVRESVSTTPQSNDVNLDTGVVEDVNHEAQLSAIKGEFGSVTDLTAAANTVAIDAQEAAAVADDIVATAHANPTPQNLANAEIAQANAEEAANAATDAANNLEDALSSLNTALQVANETAGTSEALSALEAATDAAKTASQAGINSENLTDAAVATLLDTANNAADAANDAITAAQQATDTLAANENPTAADIQTAQNAIDAADAAITTANDAASSYSNAATAAGEDVEDTTAVDAVEVPKLQVMDIEAMQAQHITQNDDGTFSKPIYEDTAKLMKTETIEVGKAENIRLDDAPEHGTMEVQGTDGEWATMEVGKEYKADSEVRFTPDESAVEGTKDIKIGTFGENEGQRNFTEHADVSDWGDVSADGKSVVTTDGGLTVTTTVMQNGSEQTLKAYNSSGNSVGAGIGDTDAGGLSRGETMVVKMEGEDVNQVSFTLDGLGGYFDERSSHATEVEITAFDKDGNEIDTQGGYRESGKYADTYEFTTNVPVDHFELTTSGSNGNYVVQNMTLSHTIVDDVTLTAIAEDGTELSLQSDINIQQGMQTTNVTDLVPASDEPMTKEVQVVDTEAMADKGAVLVDGHWVVQTGTELVDPPMKDAPVEEEGVKSTEDNDTFERGSDFFENNENAQDSGHHDNGHHYGQDKDEHHDNGRHNGQDKGEDHDDDEDNDETHQNQEGNIDGGSGFDTLVASDNSMNIDLSALDGKVQNIEAINLNDGDNQISNINLEDVMNITDDNNILTVEGGDSDTIHLNTDTDGNGEWKLGDFKTDAETGDAHQEYTGGESDDTVTLNISTDIQVDQS